MIFWRLLCQRFVLLLLASFGIAKFVKKNGQAPQVLQIVHDVEQNYKIKYHILYVRYLFQIFL